MLYVHETHTLIGEKEHEFEMLYRDEWMPTLGKSDDTRLLWYLRHPPVVGRSFTCTTVIAVRDGQAWEDLGERVRDGDLASLSRDTDRMRRDVTANTLVGLPWAPAVQEIPLEDIPTTPGDHEATLWIQDTLWPFEGKFEEYIKRCGRFVQELDKRSTAGTVYLDVRGGYRTAFGSGVGREIWALSRIIDPQAWLHSAINSHPAPVEGEPRGEGWGELTLRERWLTYLLNIPTWAPVW